MSLWWWSIIVGLVLSVCALYSVPTDALHPTSITVGDLSDWRLIGIIKRMVVRILYDYMANYPVEKAQWQCMNYGYAVLENADGIDNTMVETLTPEEQSTTLSEPYNYQLYYKLLQTGLQLSNATGLTVLEVGSGRGGGTAFISRRFRPEMTIGVDISADAVRLSTNVFSDMVEREKISFIADDAENLSKIATDTVDIVVNVESQHCYASVERFSSEAHRVLRTGGRFLFAGFTQYSHYEALKRKLSNEGKFKVLLERDITPNVIRSLQLDENRKRDLITTLCPTWFTYFAKGFAAMDGSTMRNAFETGLTRYSFLVFEKVSAQ